MIARITLNPQLRADESIDHYPTITADEIMPLIPQIPEEILASIHEADIIKDEKEKIVLDLYDRYIVKIAIGDEAACLRNEVLLSHHLNTFDHTHFRSYLYYTPAVVSSFFPDDLADVAILEKIDGVLLSDYIKQSDDTNCIQIIKETIDVIYRAHKTLGFTHYDLHTKNIIVSSDVPIIIDYAYSYLPSVQSSGMVLAVGAIRRETNWVHDVVKLLVSCWLACRTSIIVSDIEREVNSLSIEELVNQLEELNQYDVVREITDRYAMALDRGDLNKEDALLDYTRQTVLQLLGKRQRWCLQTNSLARKLGRLINYFSVTTTDLGVILTNAVEIVGCLAHRTKYYCLFAEETRDCSFDDFMTLVAQWAP